MKIVRLSAVTLFLTVFAANGFAALSKQYADFAKGPYQYLLTADERKQWQAIRTDEQAQQFIDLFWARRDPTPATPANEFRTAAEERVAVADQRFGQGKLKGSQTDRGKIFITMGGPTRLRRTSSEPTGTIQTPTAGSTANTMQGYSPKELWEYEQGQSPLPLGQAVAEIAFIDQYGSNEWKLDRVPRTDPARILENVAKSFITQPNLTAVPTYAPAAAAAPAPAAPVAATPAAVTNALTTQALRDAIAAARTAKPANNLYLTTGEFVTPDGEHFVPVQLWVPKSAGLAGGTEVTFFGAVENPDGSQQIVTFEEPVTLTATNDDAFYARSLTLQPGTYRATFGLARNGQPVAVTTRPLTVTGLDKTAPGVSPLLLSTHIYPLSTAQLPTDPFAFGGLKVVPRGDATFRKADELWYFVEVRNPGVDAATSKPSLTMTVSIDGTSTEGKKVKMRGASAPVEAQEMKGVTGHYSVGQAMPLSTFRPGDYTMKVKLVDNVLSKTWEIQESFKVVE